MADWTVTWKPQFSYKTTKKWDTLISTFETGEEQRRSRRAVNRATFGVQFTGLSETTARAIQAFFDDELGAYGTFFYPSYGELITGSRLALIEGGGSDDTITDSSSGFLTTGFDSDHGIWIAGSGAGNDGNYDVDTVIAGTVTLDSAEDVTAESGNTALIAYKSYNVRFVADSLDVVWVTPNVCTMGFQLVEVI